MDEDCVIAVAHNAVDSEQVPAVMHMLQLTQACGSPVTDEVEA